jgi:hypothetical protein
MLSKYRLLLNYINPILNKTVFNTWDLLKIMIPVIILIKVLQEFSLVQYLAYPFSPIMSFLGLPAEYAFAWVGALLNTNYAAFSIVITLFSENPITYEQISVLAIVCLTCHSIIVESIIAKKSGVNPFWSAFIRFISAIILGFLFHKFCQYFNVFQSIVSNEILFVHSQKAVVYNFIDYYKLGTFEQNINIWLLEIYSWFLEQVKTFVIIFAVIFGVFLLLKILEDLKILKFINYTFLPVCKLLKISKSNSFLTLAACLIGMSYGWGLFKEATKNNRFFVKQQAFSVITFISIFHAVVEESILFMLLGASFWAVFVVRLAYTILLLWGLNKFLLPRLSLKTKYKYFYVKVKHK